MSLDTGNFTEDANGTSVTTPPNIWFPSEPNLPSYNVTHLVPRGDAGSCDVSTKYGIMAGIMAVVCFMFGVLYTFFGYRFFKAIMFLTGFIFGTVLVYMILEEHAVLPPWGTLGVGVGAGVVLGLVTMLIPHTGLFLTGFDLGVAVGGLILVLVEQFVHPSTKWIPISVLVVLGVVFGVVGLRFQRVVTIVSTGVLGGALALAGVDYFVELSRMSRYFWDRVLAHHSASPCWYSWLMLALWPCLTFAGVLVQWRFTGSGIDHRIALRSRTEQGANLQHARAREKRESQQTRYRHLYQARRVKGDVISQNFIQSIQHKLSPAMQSLTALNVEPNEEESTATTTLTQVS
ncbi:transmembrane protein 198 [Aplysia californica]|uniref:Transmembrane protein 198 n=1 Tax=Aplysia californica TaxID=6500 RepID=A0ABM0JI03_APLCA|nr:transmembrane protein 198 [Aplysia californica]